MEPKCKQAAGNEATGDGDDSDDKAVARRVTQPCPLGVELVDLDDNNNNG